MIHLIFLNFWILTIHLLSRKIKHSTSYLKLCQVSDQFDQWCRGSFESSWTSLLCQKKWTERSRFLHDFITNYSLDIIPHHLKPCIQLNFYYCSSGIVVVIGSNFRHSKGSFRWFLVQDIHFKPYKPGFQHVNCIDTFFVFF